jgi:hypothetical protein
VILTVPVDDVWYPTLGPQVCEWIETHLVFGPGDLRGQPAVLDDEKRALIYRMYEVYPKGHTLAGRRRFKRAGISLPKGARENGDGRVAGRVRAPPRGACAVRRMERRRVSRSVGR